MTHQELELWTHDVISAVLTSQPIKDSKHGMLLGIAVSV